MKLSILNIVVYFFIKYFILSVLVVLSNVGISFFDGNVIDTLTYLFFCFVFPMGVPIAIILTYPIFLINRVNSLKLVLLLFFCSLILEILIYFMISSQSDYKSLMLNFLTGIILWFLFLYKKIRNWQTK
jgi:hypothetical protein